MKYYIPTTTLNIDNILSTESISPQASYAKRKFKPNYFEGIPFVGNDDVILLFSKAPSFSLNEDEIEQYPIVLEFEDDQQIQDCVTVVSSEDFSIFSCSHTIYLTPWNTHILVFDNRAYEHSKIIIESSRNCKIGSKFIWKKVEDSFPLEKMASVIKNVLITPIDSDDFFINFAKGALWGYILGLYHSKTPDAATLLRLANEMRNIVSSTISNGGVCKPIFYERLTSLNASYIKIADNRAYKHWEAECSSEESSILKKFNVFKEAISKFFKINNYSVSPDLPAAVSDKTEWISYREKLSSHTTTYAQDKSKFNVESVNFDLICFEDKNINIKGYELANEVLRLIQSGDVDKELLRIDKSLAMKKILSTISSILKKRYGDKEWDKVPSERKYINAIGRNVLDFEPFNITSVDNIELISIAAFILKGEDFDSLIRYLEDNGVYDYDIVLTLWGAIEGYASIHRGLIAHLITPRIISLVNSTVGIYSNGSLFPLQKQLPVQRATERKTSSNDFVERNTPQFDDEIVLKKLQLIKIGKKSLSKDIITAVSSIFTENNSTPDDVFYKKISQIKGVGKSAIDAIKKSIGYIDNSIFQGPELGASNTLTLPEFGQKTEMDMRTKPSSQPITLSLIKNTVWISICADMITNPKARNQFVEDMNWFIDNHKESYYDKKMGTVRGRYYNHDTSNIHVLERLKTYMENKLRPNPKVSWLADIYRNIPINRIMDYMYQMYGK